MKFARGGNPHLHFQLHGKVSWLCTAAEQEKNGRSEQTGQRAAHKWRYVAQLVARDKLSKRKHKRPLWCLDAKVTLKNAATPHKMHHTHSILAENFVSYYKWHITALTTNAGVRLFFVFLNKKGKTPLSSLHASQPELKKYSAAWADVCNRCYYVDYQNHLFLLSLSLVRGPVVFVHPRKTTESFLCIHFLVIIHDKNDRKKKKNM